MNNNNLLITKVAINNTIYFINFLTSFADFLINIGGFEAEVKNNINFKYFAKLLFTKDFTSAVKMAFGLELKCPWDIKSIKLEYNEEGKNMSNTLPRLKKYLSAPAYGLNFGKKDIEALPLTKAEKSPLKGSFADLNIIQLKQKLYDILIEAETLYEKSKAEAIAKAEALKGEAKAEALLRITPFAIKSFSYEYYLNGVNHKAEISREALKAEVESLNKMILEAEAKKAPKAPAKGKGKPKESPKVKSPAPAAPAKGKKALKK